MKNQFRFAALLLTMALVFACSNHDETSMMNDETAQLKSGQITGNGIGRYIVVFKDNITNSAEMVESLKGRFGFTQGHVFENVFKGFSAQIPDQVLALMKLLPDVAYIEPDLIMKINEQTVPTGIRRIAVTSNPVADIDGDGSSLDVDVAVIDTGVDTDHPDLNVAGGVRYYNALYTDSKYDDDHGHGSHVAGIIGAKDNTSGVVGVAPGARIWAVKVLDSNGSGYVSDIIKGLDWVTARAGTIEVANMSLGGVGKSNPYRTAIQNCVNAGVVVVVAAGNETSDVYGADGVFDSGDDVLPAAYPEAMTISALADSDGSGGGLGSETSYGPDDSFASFSNFSKSVVSGNPVTSAGKAIDLMLPGVSIYSTYKNGGYATMSGTSMASPHAAGLAALYIAGHSRATNAAGVYAIRQALIDAGKSQADVSYGLKTQNDPDSFKENVGWAGFGGTIPANKAPVAAFTFTTSGLTANFTDGSTDNDGTIVSRNWNFGNSTTSTATNPSCTYAAAGTYTVQLTVTDNGGLTANVSKSVTVTNPSAIVLTAKGTKSWFYYKVTLTWTGGTKPFKVLRNGSTIASSVNSFTYTNNLFTKGTYKYQVCQTTGSACSNTVQVTY